MSAPRAPESRTGLILAGGQGTRMGREDKGLVILRGYPLVMHVMMRLAPQVGPILISANRNLETYSDLGHRVIADATATYDGPLAGIRAGLAACSTELLLSVPCDAPALACDLAQRLHEALDRSGAQIATARTGLQRHPVFALMRRDVEDSLGTFLAAGGRGIEAWQATLSSIVVDFTQEAAAFANINSPADLQAFEAQHGPLLAQ